MTMAFNLYRKIVRYQNNLWFLSACYSSNVIPKGLTPKLLSPFPDAFFTRTWEDILLQCSKNLLSLLIIHYHRTIPTLRQRLHTTLENDKLQPTDYRSLHTLSSDLHTKHLKKLNALQKKSSDPTRHLIAPVPSSTQPPDLTHSPDHTTDALAHTTDALAPANSENIPTETPPPRTICCTDHLDSIVIPCDICACPHSLCVPPTAEPPTQEGSTVPPQCQTPVSNPYDSSTSPFVPTYTPSPTPALAPTPLPTLPPTPIPTPSPSSSTPSCPESPVKARYFLRSHKTHTFGNSSSNHAPAPLYLSAPSVSVPTQASHPLTFTPPTPLLSAHSTSETLQTTSTSSPRQYPGDSSTPLRADSCPSPHDTSPTPPAAPLPPTNVIHTSHSNSHSGENVINLTPHPLTEAQINLLAKGKGFCPVQKNFNFFQLIRDTKEYTRRCRLLEYFSDTEPNSGPNIPAKLYVKSNWTPPSGRNAALDLYCDNFEKSVLLSNNTISQHKVKDNLPALERKALYSLMNNPNLTIREADKGGSLVVMDTNQYNNAILSILANPTLYKPLPTDPTSTNLCLIQAQIRHLEHLKIIPPEIMKHIIHGEVSCPYFYGLPKIHKPKSPHTNLPPFRGIISQTHGPTVRASYWLDSVLNPLVPTFCGEHWVKDSIHVLQKLQTLNTDNHISSLTSIVAIDVVDMYNNIPHKEGIDACRLALKSHTSYNNLEISEICKLLHLVLTLNNFSFNNNHYLQLTGTAMGTPVAPSYANLFMADFWRKHISPLPNQPFQTLRYMDDIIVFHNNHPNDIFDFCNNINKTHNSIKFTHSNPDKTATFLDISIHIINNKAETDLHTKPTDSNRYLSPSSEHPKHIFRSVVYSGALRLKRICSLEQWLHIRIQQFTNNLLLSGYRKTFVQPIINQVLKQNRNTLLTYKTRRPNKQRPILVATHSQKLPKLGEIHKQHKNIIDKSDKLSACFTQPPLISLRQPPNLGNLLIRNKPPIPTPTSDEHTQPPSNHPCKKPRCKTCPFMKNTTLITTPNFKKALQHNINCE